MNTGGLVIQKGGNISQDLYVNALSSVYFPGKRIYHPSYAELSDVEIVDKLKRDPMIAQTIMFRKHLIAGRSWNVIPKTTTNDDKEIALITEHALNHIQRFEASKFNLAEAIFRGRSYAYIEGKRIITKLGNDKTERNWWIPLKLRDVGMERFRQFIESDGTIIWELWSVQDRAWKRLEHPEWFVRHIYEDTERTLNYGRGLIEAIYIYAYAKQTVLEKGLQGIDRWALGILKAKIDTERRTQPNQTTEQVLNEWLDTLEKMRTHHVLVHDKADELDVTTGGSEGSQMVKDMLHYLDNSVRILVLGSNLPTSAEAGGSYAMAEVQENSTEALVQFDRTILAETLTRDLVGLFYRLNYQNIKEIGLENANKPIFSIVQEKKFDPQVAVDVISRAINSGITLRKDEVYDKLGFSAPQDGDEVFKPEDIAVPPSQPTEIPFKEK